MYWKCIAEVFSISIIRSLTPFQSAQGRRSLIHVCILRTYFCWSIHWCRWVGPTILSCSISAKGIRCVNSNADKIILSMVYHTDVLSKCTVCSHSCRMGGLHSCGQPIKGTLTVLKSCSPQEPWWTWLTRWVSHTKLMCLQAACSWPSHH